MAHAFRIAVSSIEADVGRARRTHTLMSATILPFPTVSDPAGERDRFIPGDLAEMARWSAKAADARHYIFEDHNPDTGEATWITAAECGAEYINIAVGHSPVGCAFTIAVQAGRYVVDEIVGDLLLGRYETRGTFATLRGALEDILPTLPA